MPATELSQQKIIPSARRLALALLGAVGILLGRPLSAAEADKARELLLAGEYEQVIAAADEGLQDTAGGAEWPLLRAEALTELGRYGEAAETLKEAVERFPVDLRLRLAALAAARQSGATEAAAMHLEELKRLATTREWAYRSPADLVALGRVALLLGADPKRVLEAFFDPVRKQHPEFRESYLASAELALEKNDFALAARTFAAASKKFPNDPEMWFGLARSYAPSEPTATREALEKTLERNPKHVGAQLLLADHYIDAEAYDKSETAIAEALKTNPHHPEAHAYRAVIAHLRADEKLEREARRTALKPWSANPAVPHLIGQKLSEKYRFAEGATLQREALKFAPDFLAAKGQLANDLLRLGKDEEGWKLAEEVQKTDPYDVVAFNLMELRDAVANFRTLTSSHFKVRMEPREADIYGEKVLELLERAHAALVEKYGLQLREQTIVEIFPDQKDFAIRTFGLPGGAGYLGVCFGRVITANSPASRPDSPSNWQSVLWHEFTHVVTLTLTKNKMPRWLSEGISVYEERQAHASWGEQMKPRYRMMILSDDLTPVSQLSAAFLQPKTPLHLGFAYYESSLVAEWLVQRWGLDKMKRLLGDLARGVEINAALAVHFAPIAKLDAEFAAHIKELARKTGPKLDWEKPPAAVFADEGSAEKWISKNPDNFSALNERAHKLIEQKKWAEARVPLERLIELYPDQHESSSSYSLLARVQRELNETDAEFATLSRLADLAADATDAFERLMQLTTERQDWPKVLDYSKRYQAVDPLRPPAYRYEAEASEATGKAAAAIAAYRTLLKLDPPDPPAVHYRLARLLHAAGDPAAKRHILTALEQAPRFRDAHELLLEIAEKSGAGKGR